MKRNEGPQKRKESIAMADCVFPGYIMLSILARLPVKTILRFKSVCKPWCQLLSTREFMKMHKCQFSSDPKNQSVIIQGRTADYARPMSLWNIESDEKKPSILDYPHPETRSMNIVGCCNGLLCMAGPDNIVLWNPAMKWVKFVRVSESENIRDPGKASLGFGYDANGDDFKVVRIVSFEKLEIGMPYIGYPDRVSLEVYSVNSDSWIRINSGFQFRILYNENAVIIANGNPYWYALIDEIDVLVWFDVRKMVLKVVPQHSHDFFKGSSVLVDWKGYLGALMCTSVNERVESVDVWVFDDDDQIWRKNHTFGPIEVKLGWILHCSENGKILGVCASDNLFVFDLETGWVKVHDPQLPRIFQIHSYPYIESLTYIKGMTSEADKEEEEDQ